MAAADAPGGPVEWLESNSEKLRLVGYLLVMLGLGIPLAEFLSRSYQSAGTGTLTWFLVEFATGFGPSLVSLEAFGLGGLGALLTALVFDDKKWVQGILAWIGFGTIWVGLWLSDFHPRIMLSFWSNLGHVLLGAAAVLLIVVPKHVWESVLRFESPVSKEFRRAPRLLYASVVGGVAVLYFEYHLVYPPVFSANAIQNSAIGIRTTNLFIDTVAAAGFIATTRQFMQYDAERTVAIFGGRGVGKSTFGYGSITEYLHRVAQYADVPPLRISQDLFELIGEGDAAEVDDTGPGARLGEWFIDNNLQGDFEHYAWTIRDGDIFPTNLRVTIKDYAGENLRAFIKALAGTPLEDLEEGNPEVVEAMLDQFEEADVVVLLVDLEALRDPDQDIQAHLYADIVSKYSAEKEIVFAGTKADVYDADFRQDTGLDPYDIGNIGEFTRYVTHEVRRESNVVSGLMQNVTADIIHPVYVRTVETDAGERVPVVTDEGDFQPFGYVELLDELK